MQTKEEIQAANREACRKYREKNRAMINEKARARREADPEKARDITRRSMKKAYANNPEKYKERSKAWRTTAYVQQRSLFVEWGAKRRARTSHPLWGDKVLIKEIYDLAMRRTASTGMRWEVDHIVPLQSKLVCGLHVEDNLRVVPAKANRSKGCQSWPGHPDPLKSIAEPTHFLY